MAVHNVLKKFRVEDVRDARLLPSERRTMRCAAGEYVESEQVAGGVKLTKKGTSEMVLVSDSIFSTLQDENYISR